MTIDILQFIPTWLYIKQHTITGQLYFGKTIKDPEIYQGSGLYWKRHIKQHGREHVVTLWSELYYTADSIQQFAIEFSEKMGITKSKYWANLQNENGFDGAPSGFTHSIESTAKMSDSKKGKSTWNKGISHTTETKNKISKINLGRKHTDEFKLNCRLRMTGRNLDNTVYKFVNRYNGIIFEGSRHQFVLSHNVKMQNSKKLITSKIFSTICGWRLFDTLVNRDLSINIKLKVKNWYNDGISEYKLYPDDPLTNNLIMGNLENSRCSNKGSSNKNSKTYNFIDPAGKQFTVTGNLTNFCKQHLLMLHRVRSALRGNIIDLHGWQVFEVPIK